MTQRHWRFWVSLPNAHRNPVDSKMQQGLRLNIYSLRIAAGGLALFAMALAAFLCGMSW